MKKVWIGVLALAVCAAAGAQAAPKAPATRKKTSIADELRAMRELMEEQQRQIQALQQQVEQRDAAFRELQQQVQQTQSSLNAAQQSAQSAETNSSSSRTTVEQLQADMADVKTTLTNAAVQTQEEQKRVSGIEGTLGRFRWNGDVRVRYETFSSQSNPACDLLPAGNCEFRQRARIRLRFGVEGKLNQDFTAGLFLASGAVTDPTSTNETLTSVFERKTIAFDRGYITYNPVAHKWLSLTGGKWAYSWTRSSMTFDSDLNPEGFNEKVNFDFSHPVVKNLNLQLIQLLFNEVSAGADSYAWGGSVGGKLQVGSRWTISPAYTLLKWQRPDPIINQPASVGGPIFAPNGMTNATFVDLGGKNHFASGFLYSDLILNNTFKTWSARFPLYLIGEYEQNLDAAPGQLDAAFGAGACHGLICASAQDKAYSVELGLGQQKNQGDWQFGYEWRRQEADSVIASFNESDQRAPTNTLQNKLYLMYKLRPNIQLSFTDFIGRTLNTALQNSRRAKGIAPGETEPYLNRAQFDVIYSF